MKCGYIVREHLNILFLRVLNDTENIKKKTL